MTTARRHEALITATTEQLAAVTAIVGADNVQRLVMGDNGVPAFYDNGPEILDEIAQVLSETEQARLKTWDELDEDTQHSVLSYSADFQDLDLRHILDDRPEFKAALLHPVGNQPT